jgi:hypothetical protein
MRALCTIVFFAALLHGSAAFASEDPCSLAGTDEVERALGGREVPVPVDQIGEETAPYCLWATTRRKAEIKLTIWSANELPVLNMPDAESYFMRLEAEARQEPEYHWFDGLGVRAFEADGTIVLLKTGRVIVFDFEGVPRASAVAFVTAVAPRL